jgi:hypothetical protein
LVGSWARSIDYRYAYHVNLDKAESNAFYKIIIEAGLDPTDFELQDSARWAGIIHKSTSSYFVFKTRFTDPNIFSARSLIRPGREKYSYKKTWSGIREMMQNWCEVLKEPDLWYSREAAKQAFESASPAGEESNNTPFTQEERVEIAAQLAIIKETLRETYALH